MAAPIELGIIHHIRLTVTDIDRSRAFYTGLLGFDKLPGPVGRVRDGKR